MTASAARPLAKVGAILWIACLQYFLAEALAIQGWPGAYSLADRYISDLGAVSCAVLCSPRHALMNASFVLQGFLIAGGALLARPLFPRGKAWAAAMTLIVCAGLGVLVVGLAPEDARPGLHYAGAAANLVASNAGMAIMGAAMLAWRPAARGMGLIALAAGILGLVAIAWLTAHVDLGLGVGGVERLGAYPFPLWLAGMGVLLLRRGALLQAAA